MREDNKGERVPNSRSGRHPDLEEPTHCKDANQPVGTKFLHNLTNCKRVELCPLTTNENDDPDQLRSRILAIISGSRGKAMDLENSPDYVIRLRDDVKYATHIIGKIIQMFDDLNEDDDFIEALPIDMNTNFYKNKEKYAYECLKDIDHIITGGAIYALCGRRIKIKFISGSLPYKAETVAYRSGPDNGRVMKVEMLKTYANVVIDKNERKDTKWCVLMRLSEMHIRNLQFLNTIVAHEYAHICELLLTQNGDEIPISSKALNDASATHDRNFRDWADIIANNERIVCQPIMTYQWDTFKDSKFYLACTRIGCRGLYRSMNRPTKPIELLLCKRDGCRARTIPLRGFALDKYLVSFIDAVMRYCSSFKCRRRGIPEEMVEAIIRESFYEVH